MSFRISRFAQRLSDALPKRKAPPTHMFWFNGNSTKADFQLPKGWEPLKVFSNGALMRDGVLEDYTFTYDGFVYTVVFDQAPVSVSIGIEAMRL